MRVVWTIVVDVPNKKGWLIVMKQVLLCNMSSTLVLGAKRKDPEAKTELGTPLSVAGGVTTICLDV